MTAQLTDLRLLSVGVLVLAAAVGLIAAVEPIVAIAAAAAIIFVAVTVVNLTLGVALFTYASFLEVLPGFGALSVAKLAGGVVVLSWIAASAAPGEKRPQLPQAHPVLCFLGLLFCAWVGVSAVWAVSSEAVGTPVLRYVPNLLLFAIVFSAVRTGKDARVIAGAFVLGALTSTVYGAFINPGDSDAAAAGRVSGAGIDPNYLAASLIAALSLCAVTMVTSRNPPALRVAALFVALALFAGLASTGSRTGLVALLAATGFAVFTAGRGRRLPATILVSALLGAGAAYLAFAAPPEARSRLAQVDLSGTGRTDIWTVATRMIEANPVTGVGAGNFVVVSVRYLFEPGTITRSDFIVDDPKVAHNVYLGVWAELGIVGLVLLLAIIATAARCTLQAARHFMDAGDRQMELFARGVAVAIFAQLTAGFFVSYEYEKAWWMMMSLGPALLAVSLRPPYSERSARS